MKKRTEEAQKLEADYLTRLRAVLAGRGVVYVDEVMQSVREHIEEALADVDSEQVMAVQLANVLERLGPPESYATEESPTVAPPPPITPPAWPKVIGIISICFAGLSLVCLPVSCATAASLPDKFNNFPSWYNAATIGMSLFGILMAAVELIGGILLVRRRPSARTLLLIYGMAGLVVALANIVIFSVVDFSVVDSGAMPKATMAASGIIGTLFGMVYPIFLVIWFFRPRISQEIKSWR